MIYRDLVVSSSLSILGTSKAINAEATPWLLKEGVCHRVLPAYPLGGKSAREPTSCRTHTRRQKLDASAPAKLNLNLNFPTPIKNFEIRIICRFADGAGPNFQIDLREWVAILQKCSQPHKKLRIIIEANARGLDPISRYSNNVWGQFYDLKNFEEVVIEFTDEKSRDAERLFGSSIKPSADLYSSFYPGHTRGSIYMVDSWLRKSLGEPVEADGDASCLTFRPQDHGRKLAAQERFRGGVAMIRGMYGL